MRVIKELILDVVGELSQEFAGQSLSADDICGFMEDSDPSVIKKALEELVIAKKPLLSKTEDGEYYYSGTKEDLKNLDNPDFYEIEEKAPKAQKPVEKEESLKTVQGEAANYGLDISEDLFSGHGSKGEQGEIASPYAVIASEFHGNKKVITEGILLDKTGFEESFFKAVVAKMQSDGALEVLPTFEDFDETVYRATSKTKAYTHHVISISDIKASKTSSTKVEDEVESKPEVKLDISIDDIANAKEFMEVAILTFMEEGTEYSKHGLAADLSDKYDGEVSKFGSLGKARFASAIDKLAEEGKLDAKKRGKSTRFCLSKASKATASTSGAKESKKTTTVSKDLDFLKKATSTTSQVSTKEESKNKPASSKDKNKESTFANKPIIETPVVEALIADEKTSKSATSSLVEDKVQTGIPSEEHPAYNLAVLIKAAEISGHVDINAIAKEFNALLVGMSASSDKDKEIASLKSRLKKFESIIKQFQEA